MVTLHVDGEVITCSVNRIINAGYSGRDQEKVQEHIDELAEEGVSPPESIPMTYPVAPYTLMSGPDQIQVVGENTSGEAEVGFIITGQETYIVAASDHSDREIETDSIHKAKQITPNVISTDAWRFDTVAEHWDKLRLRAWNTSEGTRTLHQDSTLSSLMKPSDLLEEVRDRYTTPLHGTCVMSGTIPSLTGELEPGTRFEVELLDPVREQSLTLDYSVEVL
ncbi:DUF2848 domain-containing protein [Streptomyces sanglieri]